jgi:hypothetical protein
LGGEFVDDLESADVDVDASFDLADAPSDDFESEPFAPESFDSDPPEPDRA